MTASEHSEVLTTVLNGLLKTITSIIELLMCGNVGDESEYNYCWLSQPRITIANISVLHTWN